MKMKINKACDLSSISVLPPQSRRSSGVTGGLESSTILGRNQTASQLRPQQSQMSLSQGVSSQHGVFSQFSQNSQDDVLTNEKIGSQDRESSARRTSYLPLIDSAREENQIIASRTSNHLMRKWSSQENKCHINEELEHRIGMIENSLSRLGLILDSVQGDIMQVNKGNKEVALDTKDMRQKLNAHDDSLQLMNKGQEAIKSCLDMGLKSLSDQLKQIMNQESLGLIKSSLSDLSEKIESQMVKLQKDLHKDVCKEIQAISCSMKMPTQKQVASSTNGSKAFLSATAVTCHPSPQEVQFPDNTTRHLKTRQITLPPKAKLGGWTSVKQELTYPKTGNHSRRSDQKKECKIVIESDEEIDVGFSCLFKEKGAEIDKYSIEEAKNETARILRKARRRKRKYCNTIIIN
ncbi:putative recombination initiation defects 3 isoform X2 [Salvia miltiorrhiza]|uniref:putative recombination initiation defects 3 isoform X2 n=1 Tax=Salvia miltiorrhiza TaxID=226208 RepID=UPI0025ACAEDD|nr:putative recombination initiation defects 3 isoform X2 [Salvia miltiorrhiza]